MPTDRASQKRVAVKGDVAGAQGQSPIANGPATIAKGKGKGGV